LFLLGRQIQKCSTSCVKTGRKTSAKRCRISNDGVNNIILKMTSHSRSFRVLKHDILCNKVGATVEEKYLSVHATSTDRTYLHEKLRSSPKCFSHDGVKSQHAGATSHNNTSKENERCTCENDSTPAYQDSTCLRNSQALFMCEVVLMRLKCRALTLCSCATCHFRNRDLARLVGDPVRTSPASPDDSRFQIDHLRSTRDSITSNRDPIRALFALFG
jgi:hypothetical protein